MAKQLADALDLLKARMEAKYADSDIPAIKKLLRLIQKLCRHVNDLFRQQQKGRMARFITYKARDHTADKPEDDPLLSDGDEVFCVFTDNVPASRFSDVSAAV